MRRRLYLMATVLLSGCVPLPAVPGPTDPAAAGPAGAPTAGAPTPATLPIRRGFVATPGGGRLSGRVALGTVKDAYFRDNAAAYRTVPQEAAHALVTMGTLAHDLFTRNGQVISTLTGRDGAFVFGDEVPTDRPYIVNASLAGGHQLAAIALPGFTEIVVDEASTLVVELVRDQLADLPAGPGQRSLRDLTPTMLNDLVTRTRELVQPEDVKTLPGPRVPVLERGAGPTLRALYVTLFGTHLSAAGTTGPDLLSDAWKAALGQRPLAMTRLVGSGSQVGIPAEDVPADASIVNLPRDVAVDATGNMYVTTQRPVSGSIRMIPAVDRGPLLGWPGPMKAGHIYTLIGLPNGPDSERAFQALYQPFEAAAKADPAAAPPAFDPVEEAAFPLFVPTCVAVEAGAQGPNLHFTSEGVHRLFFVPTADVAERYGRRCLANHLYTVAGTGAVPPAGYTAANDDGRPAIDVPLEEPTGLVRDDAGNLLFADAGRLVQALRVVRASDGKLFTLPITLAGAALPLAGVRDLVRQGDFLYIPLPARHLVVRISLPEVARLDSGAAVAALDATVVLGNPGAATTAEPAVADRAGTVAQAGFQLFKPTSLTFDGDGNMLVADQGRLLMLTAAGLGGSGGRISAIAGGDDPTIGSGDARLVSLPDTTAVRYDPVSRSVLVLDRTAEVVRRVWATRGLL